MEDLNNRQMILLTMFTSFVVSIATGIITVAMLQVAPETVTQTVNHVVEHTIERIVTGTSTEVKAPTVVTNNVTKEVTVYAKEDDLVVSVVEKNQPRVAAIYDSASGTTSDPIAIGFVASRDGLIVTDAKGLLKDAPPKQSYLVSVNGRTFDAEPIVGQGSDRPSYFLKLVGITASTSLDSVSYGRGEPKLAQTVVVLGGADGANITKATLSKMRYAKSESTTTPQILVAMDTNPKTSEQNQGAPVMDLDGQIVGMIVADQSDAARYVVYPIGRILEAIKSIPSQSSKNIVIGEGGG